MLHQKSNDFNLRMIGEQDYGKNQNLEENESRINGQQRQQINSLQENTEQLERKLERLNMRGTDGLILSDQEKILKIQKDQMYELLKRNHDVLLEKFEIYRRKNEQLESGQIEKDKIYNQQKIEYDQIQALHHRSLSQNEDLRNHIEIQDKKLKIQDQHLKNQDEQIKTQKIQIEKFEGHNKVLNEQLDLVQKSHDELVVKKSNEIDILQKEINQLSIKQKDQRQQVQFLENELIQLKDQLRNTTNELDTRTQENDHLISLLEDQEQKTSVYEQREKTIQNLSLECKKRIEESNLERDRIQLKEASYLRQIERLEETLKSENQERRERHDRLIEALRQKHKSILDSKDDEITDLKIKLSDALDHQEKLQIECLSLKKQNEKMLDQWRNFKDEATQKYENYSKQIHQAESKNLEQNRALILECEKQREEVEQMRQERENNKIEIQELQVKLENYMRDYDRYFIENKRLREHMNTLRDEKDTSISELNRLKLIYHERVNELNDYCNSKISHIENKLLETQQRHRLDEEKAYQQYAIKR